MYRDRGNQRDYRARDTHGGGRGRYNDRGGGRGGGGGGRGGFRPKPTEVRVAVNYNQLKIKDSSREVGIDVYKVTIKSASFQCREDQDGNKVLDNSGRVQRDFVAREDSVCADDKFKKRFFSSEKPWRIYKKLVQDHSFDLFYNGAETAYAPCGSGPSEVNTSYRVCIKKDCDYDHPDREKVKNEWFEVALSKTHTIPASDLVGFINNGGSRDLTSEPATAINMIMKSAGIKSGMIALDSQSTSLIFPLEEQGRMFKRGIIETSSGDKFLISGVKQTAFFSQTGAYVQTDPLVAWFDKEKFNYDQRNGRNDGGIKLIQGNRIAGISLGSRDAQNQIEAAVDRLLLNFEYRILKPNPRKEEEMRSRGKSPEAIEDSQRRVHLNQSIKKDSKNSNSKIKWSPNDHTFMWKRDGVETAVTMTQYFFDRYGIKLDEQLPIVFVGRNGWLPLEFAYQAFAKTKGTNDPNMVQKVLQYYDGVAGSDLKDEMRSKRDLLSSKIESSLEKFNLSIANEPLEMRARVLRDPIIQFCERRANITNGSFNLMGVSFPSPGELESFAVVNFTRHSDAPNKYITTQFRVNEKHGMKIPDQTRVVVGSYLDEVTVKPESSHIDDVPEATRRCIIKAREVFLYDKLGIFSKRPASWHKTTCIGYGKVVNNGEAVNTGRAVKCLVLPPNTPFNPSEYVGLMFEPNRMFETSGRCDDDDSLKFHCTHDIELDDGRPCDRTRLKVKCNRNSELIDPFDVEMVNGRPQYKGRDIDFGGYAFLCKLTNGNVVTVDKKKVKKVLALHTDKYYDINCPSVIFELKPDKDKALYDSIKSLNNTSCGIQTQCIDYSKFDNQRNQDQYASNIAVKLNTKLSNSIVRTAAWNSSPDGNVPGIQWIGETPTLVIGIGLVHGMGYDANTVVTAFSSLDPQCMSFASSVFLQKKSDSVNKYTMFDIIKTSIQKFGSIPLRLVIYRDGMSDGNFGKADDEIAMIRETIKSLADVSCTCRRGCRMCCPPITFVICQSQNSVRVVPSTREDGYQVPRGGVNVHSGTVVDDPDRLILELDTLLTISDEDESSIRALNQRSKQILGKSETSYDFILTAQGGLKGTSKPIYYRVRLNENACWGPAGMTPLTKENLINVTYQMSFKYGTATKATRDIPLIKYAKKLGNQVLSTLKYLRDDGYRMGHKEYTLEFPVESPDDDSDNRPFIREVFNNGNNQEERRIYNLIKDDFHNHLAA